MEIVKEYLIDSNPDDMSTEEILADLMSGKLDAAIAWEWLSLDPRCLGDVVIKGFSDTDGIQIMLAGKREEEFKKMFKEFMLKN